MKKFIIALLVSCLAAPAFAADTSTGTNADSKADTKKNDDVDMSRIPVPTGRYITGGVLGSAVGFGVGHAVEGQWADRGWIFSVTEGAGLLAMISGTAACDSGAHPYDDDHSGCNTGLVTTGLVALVGFHIWEVIDIWTRTRPVDDEPAVKAMIIPDPQNPRIAINYTF